MQSTTSLVQVAFNSSLAYYGGDLYVGAMVILNSVMQFALMPAMGVAQGAQPIIGYNYGSGDHDAAQEKERQHPDSRDGLRNDSGPCGAAHPQAEPEDQDWGS